MEKLKKAKKSDESVAAPNLEAHVGAAEPSAHPARTPVLIASALIVLGLLIWGVQAYVTYRHNKTAQQGLGVKYADLKAATPAQSAKAAQKSNLSSAQKDETVVAQALRAYYAGDYKTAQSLSKKYVGQKQYRYEILCGMYLDIYDKEHNAKLVKSTAQECVTLLKNNMPTGTDEKALAGYRLGYYYEKAGQPSQATPYYKAFVSYVEANKLQGEDAVSSLYKHAQGATQ